MLQILHRATYNPGRVAVGQLTSRPLVTGFENSTISEMTTARIGNTREREFQIIQLMWWGSCRKRSYFVSLRTSSQTCNGTHTNIYKYMHTYTVLLPLGPRNHLHQQTREIAVMYLVVMRTNTMTSFWNMSKASAPIHITATSVK